jgi:ABC-type antimicrobial peptide transport system permease subunit
MILMDFKITGQSIIVPRGKSGSHSGRKSASLYITPMDLFINSLILFVAAIVAGYVPAYQVSREDIQTAMRA